MYYMSGNFDVQCYMSICKYQKHIYFNCYIKSFMREYVYMHVHV